MSSQEQSPAKSAHGKGTEADANVVPSRKVELLLKPVGDTPILKQRKFRVDDSKSVSWILAFVRQYLKMANDESLFLYVNQAFAPSPDCLISNLYDCFGSENRLVLHYSKTQAWG